MAERPALRALADRLGILPSYVDQGGTCRVTADEAREALAAAMGCRASTEDEASTSLHELEASTRGLLLDPVRMVRAKDGAPGRTHLRLPGNFEAPATWSLEVETEDGTRESTSGRIRRGGRKRVSLATPKILRPGYYDLRLRLRQPAGEQTATQRLIAVPETCPTPEEILGDRRVFGLCANLYGVRSRRSWGAGDLTDLGRLLDWCGEIGGAFVGVNPLHALRNEGYDVSPYSPVSRLFRNWLYIDVEAVPELPECHPARALMASPEFRRELCELRAAPLVRYDRVRAIKRAALELLWRQFDARHRRAGTERGRAYERYVAEQGRQLTDFATFCALDEHFARTAGARLLTAEWPVAYRRPDSPEVEAFRAAHRADVDFHRYLQFETERQLAGVAARARKTGMPIGVYQDLAIGSSADGSDAWSYADLFLTDVNVGAPPDSYSVAGQDWGLPALHPWRLAARGYDYWIRLLRAALAHAGALRIDHILGLFRQYWVPRGRPASAGAYVRFPAADLLGILALESRRAGALVVGEDLGTVPANVPRILARWGILSSKVLYFERARSGAYRAASRYPERALVTANTHDLAPISGYLEGRDLDLRHRAGVLEDVTAARSQRAAEARALRRRVEAEDEPPASDDGLGAARVRGAVHDFLCRSPGVLVGIALDDLVGEEDPVNLPGVGMGKYVSWSRRQRLDLEAVPDDPGVRVALRGTHRRSLARPDRSREYEGGSSRI